MTERIKLKRGLSDISPLFVKAKETVSPRARIVQPERAFPVSGLPEIYFIWSADEESDAHFLNNFFASKMVAPHSAALLMTLSDDEAQIAQNSKLEPWNKSLHRIRLPVTRIQEAFVAEKADFIRNSEFSESQIFLEMSADELLAQPELVRLLDHVVLFLKPQVESVTETYRKLKRLAALGINAEVTVLFDADDAGGLPARLYELFSEFVSQRLSLSVNYLGTLHLSRGGEGLRQDIRWDSWAAERSRKAESIEKMRFLSWVNQLNREEVCK